MTVSVLDWGLARASRALAASADRVRGACLSTLIFHRVPPQRDTLFPNEVDGARFDHMMALVARSFCVLPLEEAAERLACDTLPPRALCITFDDGYADNHEVALPILRRHGLHATFFIASGFIDGGRMFNDTVIECIRRCTLDAVDLSGLGLGREEIIQPAQRRALIDRLLPLAKYKTLAGREEFLSDLHTACGSPALPQDLMMTRNQVQALHRAGMGIGAHTVNHPILATLSDADARAQIDGSRMQLQHWLQAPVTTFAYPNGRPGKDYLEPHASLVRELGFKAAVSTSPGVARHGDDLHQLCRFTPWQAQARPWLVALVAQRLRS